MKTEISDTEKRWVILLKKQNKSNEELIEKDRLLQKLKEEWAEESKDFLKEIREKGWNIETEYDLVNTKESYPELIPILSKYLDANFNRRILEGIVRALTIKEARGIGLPAKLLDLYDKVPMESEYQGFRWAISNAIWFTVTKKDKDIVPRIQKIINNPNDTTEKNRFLGALKKLGVNS